MYNNAENQDSALIRDVVTFIAPLEAELIGNDTLRKICTSPSCKLKHFSAGRQMGLIPCIELVAAIVTIGHASILIYNRLPKSNRTRPNNLDTEAHSIAEHIQTRLLEQKEEKLAESINLLTTSKDEPKILKRLCEKIADVLTSIDIGSNTDSGNSDCDN